MSFCAQCGAALGPDAGKFCGGCGTAVQPPTVEPATRQPRVAEPTSPEAVTIVAPSPIAPPPIPPGPVPYEQSPNAGPQQPVASGGPATSLYSSWIRRVVAYLIDALLIWSFAGIVVAATVLVAPAGDNANDGPVFDLSTLALVSAGAIVLLGSIGYSLFAYMRSGERCGQTLGKQAMGIRVELLNGQPLSLGTFALRVLLPGLINGLTLGLFFIADAFWPLVDRRRQALHDKLAKTIVTDLRSTAVSKKPSTIASPVPVAMATVALMGLSIGGVLATGAIGNESSGTAQSGAAASNAGSSAGSADDEGPSTVENDPLESELADPNASEPDSAIPTDDTRSNSSPPSSSSNSETPEFDGYVAQISSFKRLVNAEDQRDQLVSAGIDARILRSNEIVELRPGYWVVYAGPFDEKSEAARVARSADRHGAPGAFARPATRK